MLFTKLQCTIENGKETERVTLCKTATTIHSCMHALLHKTHYFQINEMKAVKDMDKVCL